ncbi:MAG: Holliday junction branch migration protein RuvA [Kiritimatiellia bacterium]
MIAFVKGTLFAKTISNTSATAIVETAGLGYEIFVPLSTFNGLPAEGAECILYTHDYLREDTHALFGFATQEEKNLFLLLTSVSSIGPKLALSALSAYPVHLLKSALVQGDVGILSKISGIGKRTAERMVVELKGKINPLEALASSAPSSENPNAKTGAPVGQAAQEAVLALISLGYAQDQAVKAVQKCAQSIPGADAFSTAQLIQAVLNNAESRS